jgi:3-methyladenine DNA glycosylase AlkD
MNVNAASITDRLAGLADPGVAAVSGRFFKTGPGEYGEGDLFRGIRVPVLRKLCAEYPDIPLPVMSELLVSPFHEDRLLALLMLVRRFGAADTGVRAHIYGLYLASTRSINNWDLVDLSAEHIVGRFLRDRERTPIYRLAGSGYLWERRIAVMATFHYIKHGEYADTLALSELLLDDSEVLIHKAAGWMLREIGKRCPEEEEAFLQKHYRAMPRVMLRYAIERFPEDRRQLYLKGLL